MRSQRVRGIVIRRANIGEADRIVTLVTPAGKVAAVARGVRRVTSRKAGALELFNVVDVLLADTKGLPIITEAVAMRTFPSLRQDFDRVAHAYWAGELVDRLLAESAGETTLYEAFATYLTHLDAGHDPLDIHGFELVALRELGWQPELEACVHCHAPLAGERLGWSDMLGGVIGQGCCTVPDGVRPISQGTVKVLRLLAQEGYDLAARVAIPPAVITEVVRILHGYLESVGERKWKSPVLFERVAHDE